MSLVSATGTSSATFTGGSSSTVLTGCTSLTTYLAGAAHLASITGTFHITGTGTGTGAGAGAGAIISRASCTMLTRTLISRPGFFRKDLLVACLVLSRSKSQWACAQTQCNANNP